jgi:plastocyanin
MRKRTLAMVVVAAGAAALIGACGGSDAGPSPSGGGGNNSGGGGGTPTATNTITITSGGVSPKGITIARGTQVTFVNNDSAPHEMNSNPHPNHGDCPEIDQIGFLAAGQSKLTGNFVSPGTCGYHDHQRDTVAALQGTITIQ